MDDPLLHLRPPTGVESMDDPYSCFRPESDATVVKFADDADHVSADTLREELKETQVIKDSAATASALRSELDSLSALVTQIGEEFRRVQETARAALERGVTVEQRLGAIESRLGTLGDLEGVRLEIERRFDALNALTREVRADTDAVMGQQRRLEQLAVQTTAQLQQRKQRDVELGREMAVEQRLGAIESRLGTLGDLEGVRLEIEKRFDAQNALTREVRADTDAVMGQQRRLEQLAVQTTAQLQQRKQRDVELGREMAVEQRLGAIESRLGTLGDLEGVRLEIEKRFDAQNALTREVRADTDAVMGQQRRLEQLAVQTTAQLQQRKQRDVELGREMALVDRLKAGWAANATRSPGAATRVKYVAVAAVFAVLLLISAFALHSGWRTADPVGPPVVTAPVASTAVPDSPNAAPTTTSSEGSFDSATTAQSLTNTPQAASVDVEMPATRRAAEFVGTLSIRSTPDKAEVHIDRKRVGETPLVLRRLRAGSHAVWIDYGGYQRWTAGVNVPADQITRVTATLEAERGR